MYISRLLGFGANLDDRPPREIEELYAVKSRVLTATT